MSSNSDSSNVSNSSGIGLGSACRQVHHHLLIQIRCVGGKHLNVAEQDVPKATTETGEETHDFLRT